MNMSPAPLYWCTGLVLGVLAACVTSSATENHCANQDGDAYCMREHDDRPYCGRGSCYGDVEDGCLDARPADDACYSPCGGGLSLDEDPDCEGVADASSDDGPTTQPSDTTDPTTDDPTTQGTMSNTGDTETATSSGDTTGPSGCMTSDECTDPAAPICEDMECVPCTTAGDGDAACAAKDPNAPACRDDGQCVQCTSLNAAACEDTTPICDGPSSACVGCTYHEQCEGSACRIATGACFDEAEVYDVGAGQTYVTLTDAHDDLGDGAQVVLVLHAGASFDEVLELTGANTAYAFVAADGDAPQWVNTSTAVATLSVTNDAEAYVQDVKLTLNGDEVGIEGDGGGVYLDRAQVVQNTGGGLRLTNAGYAQVRNCFIGGDIGQPAIAVNSASTASLLYSTLGGSFSTSPALSCSAAGDVVVRNSILVARNSNPEVSCASASVTFSASEATAGMGNVMLGTMGDPEAAAWFENYDNGEFALSAPPAAVLTAASWRTADPSDEPPRLADDPATDIDDDARPNVDGTADVAGADIP